MQDKELARLYRQLRVGLPFIVREFNLAGPIQQLHDGANLAAQQGVRGHVYEERHDIQ